MRLSLKSVFQCVAMAILGLAGSLTAFANQSVIVDCRQGGQPVVTSGLTSTTKVLQSYPSCTITVSIHGGGLATIFSDNSGTPLANPFTAQNNPYPGAGFFYAANGRVDITISGGGIASPITFSDILLNDPATLTGCSQLPALTGDITSAGGTCTTVLPNIATPGTGLKTTINAKGQVTSNTSAASTDLSDTALIARLNAAANFGLNPITGGPFSGTTASFTAVSDTGETVAGEIAPDITGRQLGDVTHRWDAFVRNLDVSGTITGGITGSGTTNTIPKFTSASSIGNSSISDNGTTVSTSEILTALGLNINSTGLLSTTAQSGTGSICMTNSCVMTTPAIGAATATSLVVSGKITNSNWNNVLIVDGTNITTLQGCINALPAQGGTCLVPPNNVNGEYVETLTSNLVLKKNTVLQFLGQCQVTQGAFIVSIPQGADDVSIITPFAHSSDQGGNPQGCTFQGYTGAAAAFDIGSSAGFTYNTLIRGVNVNLQNAQAGAIGFRRTNGVSGPYEYDEVIGGPVSGHIGFQFVGTGALFDGTSNLIGLECNYSASSTNGKCFQWTGANQNGYAMVGGHGNMGGSANGSVCLDAAAATSRVDPGGFYCDVAATALTVESTVNTAVSGKLWADSGVTLFANFAAGSNSNRIDTNTRSIGTQLVTDSGTANTNSVVNGFDNQWNSRRWRVVSEAGAAGFEVLDQSDSSLAIAKSVGGSTQLNSSAGNPTKINPNSGDGFEVDKAASPIFVVDTTTGTTHPGAVNTAGLGTAALPWVNVKIGNAATNNITLTGVSTAARTATFLDATGNVALSQAGNVAASDQQFRRIKANQGTAYSGADAAIVLSAGWGTTATKSAASGFDQAFGFVVNSSGTGQAANPTITVTFKDGTWTAAPNCIVLRNDIITPFNTPPHTTATTATTLTVTFNGTPTAANSYTYLVHCMGN